MTHDESASFPPLIIGLAGESGAGKTTVTGLLGEMSFAAYSLSGVLRRLATEANPAATRNEIQAFAASYQATHGQDVFARHFIEETDAMDRPRAVIDGLRNMAELHHLRRAADEHGGRFVLLAVIADPRSRFERVVGRGRGGDPTSFERFAADDRRAFGNSPNAFQENGALIEAADLRIVNDGNLEALRTRLQAITTSLFEGGPPISPEEE